VSRAIAAEDTIWLNMDRADNLMVIESLMTCDRPLDHDRLLAVFRTRILERYPVFSQRPRWSRFPLAPPRWEDDPDFDVEQHVHRARLRTPGDDTALRDYLGEHLGRPLPRDRPLWEVHVLDGYGEGSAVYSRLHHSMADGIALTAVLLSLTDPSPEAVDPAAEALAGRAATAATAMTVGHLVGATATTLVGTGRQLTPQLPREVLHLSRQVAGITAKLTLSHKPSSPLSGPVGVSKCAVWGAPIPLEDVVALGHRTGTTVNDILVAALAGAVSSYLDEQGDTRHDLPTMVPVNLRRPDEPLPPELGNRFALVLFSLPSGLGTPFARLAETKRRMDAIKHSPEAWLTFGLIRAIGLTGRRPERLLVDFFADKATGVTTNVAGPREPRYLAGARITSMLGWAPQSGQQALGTCIFTYDGHVHVGFKVDAASVAEPDHLVTAFADELQVLLGLGADPVPVTR
jgi:WS/DGAT/MGAT family acyltransferase